MFSHKFSPHQRSSSLFKLSVNLVISCASSLMSNSSISLFNFQPPSFNCHGCCTWSIGLSVWIWVLKGWSLILGKVFDCKMIRIWPRAKVGVYFSSIWASDELIDLFIFCLSIWYFLVVHVTNHLRNHYIF